MNIVLKLLCTINYTNHNFTHLSDKFCILQSSFFNQMIVGHGYHFFRM